MRPVHLLSIATAAGAVAAASVALAAHPKVDPATVPTGFFTAHSRMSAIPTRAIKRVLKRDRAAGFLQHIRLGAGEATGFVTHPGPVFVMVARGTVTNEEARGGDCRRTRVSVDRGFVTKGRRTPHRMTAGESGAELYLFYLAPPLTGATERAVATPDACR
jgi:hypothetical protein